MPYKIRRAKISETEMLTDLAMRSKRSNGYDDSFMEACRDELTVSESRLLAGEYWVAESDAVVGVVCLQVQNECSRGEIHAFFVDPDCQRQGIGKILWQQVLQRAGIHGLTQLQLDADPGAVPFYEVLGFNTIGHSPSGSIAGRNLPRMEFVIGCKN